jgi:phosphoglycolate phosphatase-like HAD superfamily hydrolase
LLDKIRLLIFDLDYLVFDCAALKLRALRHCLLEFADQIPTDARLPDSVDIEECCMAAGHKWVSSMPLGLDESGQIELAECYLLEESRHLESGAGVLFPGIRDLFSGCRDSGLILGLGADSRRDYLMSVSDRLGLDQVFEVSLCTEEYGSGRTEEMFEDILQQVEVLPSEAIILGTRSPYFEAARGMNIPSIGCGWGLQQKKDFSAAVYESPSLAHLVPLIRQADAIAASSFE